MVSDKHFSVVPNVSLFFLNMLLHLDFDVLPASSAL